MNVITNLLVNGVAPVIVGGSGTGLKWFPALPGASIGATNNLPGMLFVPGNNEFNGQLMHVFATGNATMDQTISSPAITISLGALKNPAASFNPNNQPTTAPSFSPTTIASSQHAVSGYGTATIIPWSLEAWINADNASGLLQGSYKVVIDNVTETGSGNGTSAITSLSGVSMSSVTPFGLAVGVTFSVSGTANSASLYQFSLEA